MNILGFYESLPNPNTAVSCFASAKELYDPRLYDQNCKCITS